MPKLPCESEQWSDFARLLNDVLKQRPGERSDIAALSYARLARIALAQGDFAGADRASAAAAVLRTIVQAVQ